MRAAALAAALLPLASIAATPAEAQTTCPSGGICGTVFEDVNGNGTQDAGEPGIEGAKVFICVLCDGSDTVQTETGPDGSFTYSVASGTTSTVAVQVPEDSQPSPANVENATTNDTNDSDGVPDGNGFSTTTVTVGDSGTDVDFGFVDTPGTQPGTGTPGYWKNHTEAWPVASIEVGGLSYTKDEAIAWLKKVGKDKTTTMFSSLVPAMLNIMIGNDGSCVSNAVAAGNAWMATYGPVGSNVAGGSAAWAEGQPTHQTLDAYNNGLLCAPHRD